MHGDLHIRNAKMWTGIRQLGGAPGPHIINGEGLTIRGERIASIGQVPTEHAEILDAEGAFIIPGLIDSHVHLLMGGRAMTELDLSQVRSRREFESAISERHKMLPEGDWLIARGWSEENWPGRNLPTLDWLRSAGQRPVVCYRMDFHAALVNHALLSQIDWASEITGGRVQRDDGGTATGMLFEAAVWQRVNPLIPGATVEQKRGHLRAAMQHLNSLGITAVGAMEYAEDILNVLLPLRRELSVRCRCIVMDRAWPMTFELGTGFPGDEFLGVIGYKAFADGTMGSRTARMLADYSDEAGNRGIFVELAARTDGALRQWAQACASAGMSPCIHAIGDEGARAALGAIDGIHPELRPRIEHAQQIAVEDLPRFADVIASMQPLHKADDGRFVAQRVGTERLVGTFAYRKLKIAGARLAFGSDWPVVSADPMLGIRAAVTGRTIDSIVFLEHENLSAAEALEAYTSDAAYAVHLDRAGVLARGALADLVMLDENPFEVDWNCSAPRVMATMVGGKLVYDAR